jgi:hypothetical protein
MDWSRLQLAPEVTVAADSNAQRTGSGNSVLGAGTWSKPSGVSEYEPLPLQVPDSVGAVVPPGGEGTGRLQLAAGGLYNKQSLPNGLSVDGPGTPNGEQTGPEGTLADGFEHTKKVLQIFPAVDAADYAAARSENPIGNSGYGLGQRPSLEVGYTERDTLPAVTVDPAGDRVPVGGLGGFAVDPLMRTKRKRDEGNRSAAADFLGDFSEEFVKHPRTKLRIHGIKNGKKKLQGNKELKGKKTTFVDEE